MFQLDLDIGGCRVLGRDASFLSSPGAYSAALNRLSEYRKAKAVALHFEADRQMSVAAGLLLDELLRERGYSEREMSYAEGSDGKPSFPAHPEMFFSIAHAGGAAVAALSDAPVGVDIERLDGFPYDIAEPRRWTEMEAVGKLLGCGVGCYVDAGRFEKPEDTSTSHMEKDGYIVCIARKTA